MHLTLFSFCLPGSFVQVNSGKWIMMSFKCPTGETGLGEVERVCLELFHVVSVQNGREICSEGIVGAWRLTEIAGFPFS